MIEALFTVLLLLTPGPPRYCAVRAITDYQFGFGRIVRIDLDPTCPPGATARVQAVSASRSRRKPDQGAWTLDELHRTRCEFLAPFWNVEYWDGHAWVKARGR